MTMRDNETQKNGNQNMPMNRPYIAMILVSIESWHPWLSIGTTLVKIEATYDQFMGMF